MGRSLDPNDTRETSNANCTSTPPNDASEQSDDWEPEEMKYRDDRELCPSGGYPIDSVTGHKPGLSTRWILLELYEEWDVHCQIRLLGGN